MILTSSVLQTAASYPNVIRKGIQHRRASLTRRVTELSERREALWVVCGCTNKEAGRAFIGDGECGFN